MDINRLVESLSKKGPRLKSEEDFKYELAWEVKINYPKTDIRVDFPLKVAENKIYPLDLFISYKGKYYSLELKFIDNSFREESLKEFLTSLDELKDLTKTMTEEDILGYGVLLTSRKEIWDRGNLKDLWKEYATTKDKTYKYLVYPVK